MCGRLKIWCCPGTGHGTGALSGQTRFFPGNNGLKGESTQDGFIGSSLAYSKFLESGFYSPLFKEGWGVFLYPLENPLKSPFFKGGL